MRSLLNDAKAVIEMGMVLVIGIAFAGLMVIAYLIWTLNTSFGSGTWDATLNNVTAGFDDAISLILVAITIFILAIAIGALLMLRGR